MANHYKVTLYDYNSDGPVEPLDIAKHPESEPWQDVTSVMNDKFVRIGNHVIAADTIKIIEYVEV
jgi:hypothetical protein